MLPGRCSWRATFSLSFISSHSQTFCCHSILFPGINTFSALGFHQIELIVKMSHFRGGAIVQRGRASALHVTAHRAREKAESRAQVLTSLRPTRVSSPAPPSKAPRVLPGVSTESRVVLSTVGCGRKTTNKHPPQKNPKSRVSRPVGGGAGARLCWSHASPCPSGIPPCCTDKASDPVGSLRMSPQAFRPTAARVLALAWGPEDGGSAHARNDGRGGAWAASCLGRSRSTFS